MKKLLIRVVIGLVIIIIVAVVVVGLSLDGIIKKGVETVGPQVAKVDVKLDSVSLHLLTGSGTIKGLVVGNPDGYKTTNAISVGTASVSVKPGSLMSDKIVVRSIRIEAPQVTYELGPGGNNLKRIQANVTESTGGAGTNKPVAAETKEAKPGKKLEVDDVLITGGTVTVGVAALGGKMVTVPLPEIHFAGLGTGPDGITAGELTKKILSEITEGSIKAAAGAAAEVSKAAGEAAKGAVDKAGSTVKGVTDLFKKK